MLSSLWIRIWAIIMFGIAFTLVFLPQSWLPEPSADRQNLANAGIYFGLAFLATQIAELASKSEKEE